MTTFLKGRRNFFWGGGNLSQIWVGGVQIPKISMTFTNHYFSAQALNGWVGQSKPKTKSKFWVKFIKCKNNNSQIKLFCGGLP